MSAVKRLLIDVLLLAAIVAAYKPGATGFALHEWLSLALAIPILVHLVVNWDWVGRAGRALFHRLRRATRLNFAVDSLLFVATITVMLSGFAVSRALAGAIGLATDPEPIWYAVHSVSAGHAFCARRRPAPHMRPRTPWGPADRADRGPSGTRPTAHQPSTRHRRLLCQAADDHVNSMLASCVTAATKERFSALL